MSFGYFPVPNDITQHEWYTESNTFRVYFHLLMSANFEDSEWRGISVKTGEFKSSVREIAAALDLSLQQTRTALANIQTTHWITCKPTNKYTIYVVERYEEIRKTGSILTSKLTNKQHTEQQTNNTQANKQDNKQEPDPFNKINKINKSHARVCTRVDPPPKLGLKSCIKTTPGGEETEPVRTVIARVFEKLNRVSGKTYRAFDPQGTPTSGAKSLMQILKTYPAWDVEAVINQRAEQWGNDVKMSEFLRPATLFRKSNFENYVGEISAGKGEKSPQLTPEQQANRERAEKIKSLSATARAADKMLENLNDEKMRAPWLAQQAKAVSDIEKLRDGA